MDEILQKIKQNMLDKEILLASYACKSEKSIKLLDEDAYNTMMALTGDEYSGYMSENFGATPMVLIIEKGKIIGAQTGYSEYETFEKVLTDAGFKK